MPPSITHRDFQIIRKLNQRGDGGLQNNGIYLARHVASNKVYIEKRLVASGFAKREIQAMLLCLQHPHIVSIFAFDQRSPSSISIYMQHCELGSLDALIMRYNRRSARLQDEGFLFRVFWHLALAVCYLWTGHDYTDTRQRAFQGKSAPQRPGWAPLLHRDIKPGNVFMTRDTSTASLSADSHTVYPCIVLGDFGCVVSTTDRFSRHADQLGHGDPRFEPPERAITMQSDVFCVGVVLHCLARMAQFPDDIQPYLSLGRQYTGSMHLAHLARECLATRPHQRPSPLELPKKVFEGYRVWRQARGRDGDPLPTWAFG